MSKKDSPQELLAIATPPVPNTGYVKVYPKADGNVYALSSAGSETQLTNATGSSASGPFFKGILSGGQAVAANTPIAFTTIEEDTSSAWNASLSRWVCPLGGLYDISFTSKQNGGTAQPALYIRRNGAIAAYGMNPPATSFGGYTFVWKIRLTAGDYIDFAANVAFATQTDAPAQNNWATIQYIGPGLPTNPSLYTSPVYSAQALGTATTATTTGSFVDVPGLVLNVVCNGPADVFEIDFTLDVTVNSAGIFITRIFIDNALGGDSYGGGGQAVQTAGTGVGRMNIKRRERITGLSAGTHQIKVQGGSSGGSFNINSTHNILLADKVAGSAVTAQDTGWIGLPFAANWTNYAAPYQNGQYRRIGNQVFLRGTLMRQNSASGTGSTICTLPVGFRPVNQLILVGDSTGAHVQFNITSAGALSVYQNIGVNGDVTIPASTSFWID